MNKNKILITGGTGFIGSHIVEYFKSMGENIYCITRAEADIRDLEALTIAFKDGECVIHNAALASDWGKYNDFYQTNVSGTLNVIKACKANNIKKLIITGSCSVYGEENNTVIKNEESAQKSHYKYFMHKIFPCGMNYYRDTKQSAKATAINLARLENMNLIVLDPVWVYGEREFNTGFYEYLKTAKSKIPFIMGSKKNKFHVIYAKDLAKAYYLAYKANLPGINSIIIGNEKAEYMHKIFNLFCTAAGYKKPRNAPKILFYPIGFFMELLGTLFRAKKVPFLTRGRVNMFYDNIEYSTQRAKDVLGFECEYSLERGIEKTVNWYKSEGYL